MLQNLSEPSSIGPAIAAAFMATLYGVSIANLFLLPVANKLRVQHMQEFVAKRLAMEGALGIARGESPSVLRDHLIVMLPPTLRNQYLAAGRAPAAEAASQAAPEGPVEAMAGAGPGAQT
jgi:chemotaxis protein MotA